MNLKILAAKRWNHYQDSKTKGRIFDIEPGGGFNLKKNQKKPKPKMGIAGNTPVPQPDIISYY